MEGDAGARRLNPDDPSVPAEAPPPAPSRLNSRSWFAGVSAALLVLSAAITTGGYFALRAHQGALDIASAEAAATQAAKDCVAATQAPNTAAMAESQQKIIECATGDYSVQATLYSGVLLEAYQAANAQVQVTDMRAAVERHNDDGSMDVLVALRVKLTNSEVQEQETGYRLRVQMAPDNGTYKIARLDQVTT